MLLLRQEDALELVEREIVDGDLRMYDDSDRLGPPGLGLERRNHRTRHRDRDERHKGYPHHIHLFQEPAKTKLACA